MKKYALPVVIGVVLCTALALFPGATEVVGGISTIILTAILVAVTWYYADETRTMRQEAQISRLFNMPVIRLTGTLTREPNVAIRNIGRGFARDVNLEIVEIDGDKEPVVTSLQIPILGPGEGVEFKPRSYPSMTVAGFNLGDHRIEFSASGAYFDAAGTQQTLHDEFSLSDFINHCEALGVEFAPVSHESEWHRTIEEDRFRSELLKQLSGIANSISRFRL